MQYPINFINIRNKFGNGHYGIDFGWDDQIEGATSTQPIYAVDNGEVISIQNQNTGGNVIIIRHDNGFCSEYAHLSKILVKKGTKVKEGEQIGNMGATGIVTGPHLHFGLYKGKALNYDDHTKFVDPIKYLRKNNNQIISPKSLIKNILSVNDLPVSENKTMYVDNTDYEGVNVRNSKGKIVRVVPIGTKVNIVKEVNGKSYLNNNEYVSSKYISSKEPILKVVASPNGLNVRTEPSSSSKIIAVLPFHTKVKAYKTSKGWSKISPDREAWVSTNYLK